MSDLLNAISALQQRLDERFDQLDAKVDKKVGAHDTRLRAVERDLVRIKTVGAVFVGILSFFRWPQVKLWLTALTKS